MRASVYIAASLDGFIARSNGDIDWLPAGNSDGSPDGGGKGSGYRAFLDTVDVLVMGRRGLREGADLRRVAVRGPAGRGSQPRRGERSGADRGHRRGHVGSTRGSWLNASRSAE